MTLASQGSHDQPPWSHVLVCFGSSATGHVGAGVLDGAASRNRLDRIGCHDLCTDLNGLRTKAMLADKVLRGEDDSAGTVRSGAALEESKGPENCLRVHDFLQGVHVLELRIRVERRMRVVFLRDASHMNGLGLGVLFHVLNSSVAEHLGSARCFGRPPGLGHDLASPVAGVGTVVEKSPERSGKHFLKAKCKGTVVETSFDGLTGEVDGGRAGRAIVVDVHNGHLQFQPRCQDYLCLLCCFHPKFVSELACVIPS